MKVEIEYDKLHELVTDNRILERRVTELQQRGNELQAAKRSRAYGGILSGPEILNAVSLGDIVIDPFREEHVNPASIDLTLGASCAVYQSPAIDCAISNQTIPFGSSERDGRECFHLFPGELYLMHTEERIATERFVPVIDGKSSLGRLGIKVHETAGYGDPGFDGQYTLEVTVLKTTVVYIGMRFCQVRFHTLVGEISLYRGNYRGSDAVGPVASKSHVQMATERDAKENG